MSAESARARKKKYLARLHDEKYGPGAPDMRGRHGNHARGAANAKWNPGVLLTSHGYVAVRVPLDHPHAWGAGYAYEHILVAEAAIGRSLADDELVHHKDRTKTNNVPDNLEVKTISDHAREHDAERGRDELGRFPPLDTAVREMRPNEDP